MTNVLISWNFLMTWHTFWRNCWRNDELYDVMVCFYAMTLCDPDVFLMPWPDFWCRARTDVFVMPWPDFWCRAWTDVLLMPWPDCWCRARTDVLSMPWPDFCCLDIFFSNISGTKYNENVFAIITYFWMSWQFFHVMTNFLTSWQTLNVMVCFWYYDELCDTMNNFVTWLSVFILFYDKRFDIMIYCWSKGDFFKLFQR